MLKACTENCYIITREDLPLSCPSVHMEVWDAHPRVYLPLEENGEAICPYCNAKYIYE